VPLLFAGLRLGEAMSTAPFVITEMHSKIEATVRFDSGIEFTVTAAPNRDEPGQWGLEIEGFFGSRAERDAAQHLMDHAAELIAVLRAAVEDESAHLLPEILRP